MRIFRSGGLLRNWLSVFLEPRHLLALFRLPRYFQDWGKYAELATRNQISWRNSYPCLADALPTSPFDPHYFYQAHWAAERLAQSSPRLHVDIGSSALFVSTASAFTPFVFVDYRPLRAVMNGFHPMGGDITRLPFATRSISSLSCLHVIEHIGLGRYGDPIDPSGAEKAVAELDRVLCPNGRLLLTTPVGRERLQFNAHRIFAPATIISMLPRLRLQQFALVDDAGRWFPDASPEMGGQCQYGCGMFDFAAPTP